MSLDRSQDDELLARYRDADFRAFDLFYQRNHSLILGFLLSRLKNRADAEEAFQETFFRVHRAILSYDPSQRALAWVFTIARNVALDFVKRRRYRQTVPVTDDIAIDPRTESAHVAREELQQIMTHLTEDERTLIVQRLVEEEAFETIAEKARTSANNVRQRLSRLLRRLRA